MNLYLRLLWTLIRARFKPRIVLGDTIELKLRVWPNDLDVNGHMNNGRYMTITDLAIIEYFSRSGFLGVMLEKGWRPMLGGSMISFRRGLESFKAYTLRFSMLCWDDRWSYMRFEFLHAGKTMAVGQAKGAIVGRQGIVSSNERFTALGMDQTSPAFPPAVQAWVEAERLIPQLTTANGVKPSMNDVSNVPSAASADLTYPLGSPPLPGESCEVAPGVHWLRMPLPMSLNHINLWALEDGDGWTLVDTGMRTDDITSAWQNVMSGLMADRPVKRVICTHMHPDHIGMAGWLTRRFDCPLWITRLEYLTCRTLVSDMAREAPADALRFYRAAGWDGEALERYKTRFGHFGKVVYTLPDSFRRIADGEEILIGGRTWRVVVGRGHSPEHACLYCPELGVLISGDQVLPKITSNVSVFPTEPEADPLTDWLESLAAIKLAIPDDVLVLPSHNEPFRGLHARIAQLLQGHETALGRVKEALAERKTATDIFSILFRRPVSGDVLSMATGESVAHLNCLIHRGHATRETDASGISWYRST